MGMKALVMAAGAAVAVLHAATGAVGADFRGYDPTTFDGAMLPADQLQAMVTDAMQVTPPKNGQSYVIGFANLQRDIPFCALVEQGIKENAEAAGIELVV